VEVPRQLYPTFEVNADAARWDTDACAPLARTADQIEPIWRRLAARSPQIGYPLPAIRMVNGSGLHLEVDGQVVQPISAGDSCHTFVVPAGIRSVSLVSRFCIPADKLSAGERDLRRLGVCVEWMAIRTDRNEKILGADDPALLEGWNGPERQGDRIWRWTSGSATVPWQAGSEAAILTVRCKAMDQYPLYDERACLVA
jgi:hypothetical protein